MKTSDGGHAINYFNTFIGVALDSPVRVAQIPPQKITYETKTVKLINMYKRCVQNAYKDLALSAKRSERKIP